MRLATCTIWGANREGDYFFSSKNIEEILSLPVYSAEKLKSILRTPNKKQTRSNIVAVGGEIDLNRFPSIIYLISHKWILESSIFEQEKQHTLLQIINHGVSRSKFGFLTRYFDKFAMCEYVAVAINETIDWRTRLAVALENFHREAWRAAVPGGFPWGIKHSCSMIKPYLCSKCSEYRVVPNIVSKNGGCLKNTVKIGYNKRCFLEKGTLMHLLSAMCELVPTLVQINNGKILKERPFLGEIWRIFCIFLNRVH